MLLKPAGLPKTLAQLNHSAVMGILNVTPDSFSDGGLHLETGAAVAHGIEMVKQGADIVDVGGESTRPGAQRISADEELQRVIPVVERLVNEGIIVSVDTMRATVAQQAIQAGAHLINDVSGGLADEDMFQVVSTAKIPYIMMHWRAHSNEMQNKTQYEDVVSDVIAELHARVQAALEAGIAQSQIVIDPGIGFSKTSAQNWSLLRNLEKFGEVQLPVLVGVSRKRFLGELLAGPDGERDVENRDNATTAITTLLAHDQIWAVRVHNVQAACDAISVVEAMRGNND